MTGANPRDLQAVCDDRRAATEAVIALGRDVLAAIEKQPPERHDPESLVWSSYSLAQVYAYLGQMAKATALLENARDIVAKQRPRPVPGRSLDVRGAGWHLRDAARRTRELRHAPQRLAVHLPCRRRRPARASMCTRNRPADPAG